MGQGDIRHHLDTLPRSSLIAVLVFLALRVVGDPCALDIHSIRPVVVIRLTARPGDGPVVVRLVACSPDAQSHTHRRLREAFAAFSAVVEQLTHRRTVDEPCDALIRPARRVIMKPALRIVDGIPLRARRCRSDITLAIIVRLPVCSVCPRELPVHLVQIIGLEHDAADDSLARRGFHPDFDLAEEYRELRLDSWCISAFGDRELSATVAVDDVASAGVPG